jgi:hypothetical protein
LEILDRVRPSHRERDDVVVLDVEVPAALDARTLVALEDREFDHSPGSIVEF